MSLSQLLVGIYSNVQVHYLVYLLLANLILGLTAALKSGELRLSKLAGWLETLASLMLGYGAAAILAIASPDLKYVQDAAFAFLSLQLLGYALTNLKDLGIPLPDVVAGKPKP